jgi:hypothetical protein
MSKAPAFCASCGARASGKFCSNCGAALVPGVETGAAPGRAPVPAPAAGPSGVPIPWVVAGGAIALAALAVLLWGNRSATSAGDLGGGAAAAEQAASPPDLSTMSSRERFDRLFNRIMTAAEAGNTAEVTTFLPMAKMAYAQLDTVNIDARYHMAMLDVQGGNAEAALAQADSIGQLAPQHLFIFLIREAEAARRGDSVAVRKAHEGFLAAYDLEIALERIEYAEHRNALERFRGR